MDAAITAWELETRAPLAASSSSDEETWADFAGTVIARCLMLVSGAELLSVDRGPILTLTARIRRPCVRARLLQVLEAISALLPDYETLEIRDAGGALIVAGRRESFVLHRASCPETWAITALYPLFDAAVSLDEDRDQAAQDAVAVMVGLLAPDDIEGSGRRIARPAALHRVALRSLAIRTFIAMHSLGRPGLDRRFTTLLRRAEGAAMAAAHGDQGAFSRMVQALNPIFAWTTRRTTNCYTGLLQPW